MVTQNKAELRSFMSSVVICFGSMYWDVLILCLHHSSFSVLILSLPPLLCLFFHPSSSVTFPPSSQILSSTSSSHLPSLPYIPIFPPSSPTPLSPGLLFTFYSHRLLFSSYPSLSTHSSSPPTPLLPFFPPSSLPSSLPYIP